MAPEPYPQEKWTREQEKAYADGRKSAQASQSGSPRSGRRRRVVRTDAGARRYGVPIGAEIGSARNAKAAEAQTDTESRDRYEALVGQDEQAQRKAMAGLDTGQLQRLARIAYSWRTADPHVVRLRIGVANELRRRGFNVNDFGGLGGGSVHPPGPTSRSRAKVLKRPGRPATSSPARKGRSAMVARRNDRRLRELSVPQLRRALSAFARMDPKKREPVARFLVRQAIELSATNLIGRSVFEAANLSGQEAIELAGRWKHGWIPLDSVAMRSKMKGGNGKPWWTGGKQRKTDSASTMRRTLEGKRIAAERKARGETPGGGKPRPFVAVLKQGGTVSKAQPGQKLRGYTRSNELDRMDKGTRERIGGLNREGRFGEAADVAQASRKTNQTNLRRREGFRGVVNNRDTKNRFAAKKRVPEGRTTVVKSSPKPERGSKMDFTPEYKKRYGGLNDSELAAAEKDAQLRAQTDLSASQDLSLIRKEQDRRASMRADVAKAPDRTASKQGNLTPRQKADNYVEMHGTTKARARLKALQAKERDGKLTPKFRTEMDALKQALDADSERAFQRQKSRSRLTPEQLAKRGFQGGGTSGKA